MDKNNHLVGQHPLVGQSPPMKLDILTLKNEICKKCGGEIWIQACVLKKVSKIQSPSGKNELGNIPIIICVKCNNPYPSYAGLLQKKDENKNPDEK